MQAVHKHSGFSLILLIAFLVLHSFLAAQQKQLEVIEQFRKQEMLNWNTFKLQNTNNRSDTNINVKFYHLNIEIAIDSAYIIGEVTIKFMPVIDDLEDVKFDLNRSLTVTAVTAPAVSFNQNNDQINITLDQKYQPGELISLTISYQGKPVEAGGYKGLRYETHGNNEPVIATLSTPFLAHYWYPCKDGPQDKADSVYVDITIEKRVIAGKEIIAVSNGILEDTISSGNYKTFKWRHRYPIVTYYVMVAISNYVHFTDYYERDGGETMPLDYFAFNEVIQSQQQGVIDLPDVIDFFENIFGDYPFFEEKYGMTQLGYYGAIENQTNTITNSMEPNWFLVSVHELAHMWFADMITCETWNHGWINEGFATYSEALWVEHDAGHEAYLDYMDNLEFFNGGTLYLESPLDTFNVFTSIIYYKGAYALHMLRGVVGDSLFFESLKSYATDPDYIYQTATTEDLQEVFETTGNTNLETFFDQWIYDEFYPIYHYNFVQLSDKLFVTLYQAQEELNGWRSLFEMPVPVKIKFTDGTDTTLSLWNDYQLQQFEIPVFSKNVNAVYIDPEKWILRKVHFKNDLPVSIDQQILNTFCRAYPNPVKNNLTITIQQDYLPALLKIFDLTGNKIVEKRMNTVNTIVNTQTLNKGIYFYSVDSQKNMIKTKGKFIKN